MATVSNSFGFGGANGVVVFGAIDGHEARFSEPPQVRRGLAVTLAHAVTDKGLSGIAALKDLLGPNAQGEAKRECSAFPEDRVRSWKRELGIRYMDPQGALAMAALGAVMEAGFSAAEDPRAVGLFLWGGDGPTPTHRKLYENMRGESVSATIFSSCGYNIIPALLARASGATGPALYFGATAGLSPIDVADQFITAGRISRALLVGYGEDFAVVAYVQPDAGDTGSGRHGVPAADVRMDGSDGAAALLSVAWRWSTSESALNHPGFPGDSIN